MLIPVELHTIWNIGIVFNNSIIQIFEFFKITVNGMNLKAYKCVVN